MSENMFSFMIFIDYVVNNFYFSSFQTAQAIWWSQKCDATTSETFGDVEFVSLFNDAFHYSGDKRRSFAAPPLFWRSPINMLYWGWVRRCSATVNESLSHGYRGPERSKMTYEHLNM